MFLVFFPFEVFCMLCFFAYASCSNTPSWTCCITVWPLILCSVTFFLPSVVVPSLALLLPSILFEAHVRFLHLCSIACRCSCSVLTSSCVEHLLYPCVLIAVYMTDMSCKYWSMCEGFPYTPIDNVLF